MALRTTERKTAQTSQTADRALEVLFVLLRENRPLALGEIGRACGLAPSTSHRLVSSLVRYNLVKQDPETSKYALGLGLLEFGNAILNSLSVRELAAAPLTELNRFTQETIHLAVLDDLAMVYIDRRDTPHAIRLNTSIGRRGTPHTTGVGKALLAFAPPAFIDRYLREVPLEPRTPNSITDADALRDELECTRERGYAIDRFEDKPHVLCIAAPILDGRDNAIAAVSVSVPDSRHSLDSLLGFAPALLERTRQVSRSLGHRPDP